jgi:hypothetical protein
VVIHTPVGNYEADPLETRAQTRAKLERALSRSLATDTDPAEQITLTSDTGELLDTYTLDKERGVYMRTDALTLSTSLIHPEFQTGLAGPRDLTGATELDFDQMESELAAIGKQAGPSASAQSVTTGIPDADAIIDDCATIEQFLNPVDRHYINDALHAETACGDIDETARLWSARIGTEVPTELSDGTTNVWRGLLQIKGAGDMPGSSRAFVERSGRKFVRQGLDQIKSGAATLQAAEIKGRGAGGLAL